MSDSPRTDAEVELAMEWANKVPVVSADLARQLERELAQAKAELSALSRASGEAVAWGEIRKMKGGELAIFTASYNVIMAKFTSGGSDGLKDGTKLYLAAPTAPGMCLVPEKVTDEMVNAACEAADNGNFSGQYLQDIWTAMLRAAAKGRAAT